MPKYSIGIDFGGTKIIAGVVNKETGEVVGFSKKKTKKDCGAEAIVEKIIKIIEEAILESKISIDEVDSIGMGLAGQVDREKGVLIAAPNLHCFNIEFKKILEKKFKKPVVIGNDVEIATIGEMKFGAGRGYDSFVCVFVGTGVGSGIVLNGKLLSGATGTAGEIGHIIVASDGRACGCGGNGCLEAYASRTAIEQKIRNALKKGHKSVITDFMKKTDGAMRSKHLSKAIEANDEIVINCITEATDYLSSGLASVINFLNPQLIILGGGLIEAVDFFFKLTAKKALSKALEVPSKNTKITRAELGDFSGVIGAACLKDYRNEK